MRIDRDGIRLCADCMIAAVNGDYTALDCYGDAADAHMAEIDAGLAELGPHLVPAFDSETGEGMDEFSSARCDCCGTGLAGARYEFATLTD